MSNTPKIAAITQCYQEDIMLPLWVSHYSKLVGRQNLWVIDHGSSPPVTLEGVNVINSPRSACDDEEKAHTLSTWHNKLLSNGYDWVISTDTDEFITHNPSHYETLADYLSHCPSSIRRCVGVEVLDPGDVPPINWEKPILQQRPCGIITKWSCKPAVSALPTSWLPGQHDAMQDSIFDHNLWLFHLKYADETHLFQRLAFTRSLVWSEGSLASGHGSSHRVPDIAMQHHLNRYRSRKAEGNLSTFLASNPDPKEVDSPLLDIPEVFQSLL
ncbi:glycosyltransferase family 2 protein [Swingsia samuiensis]|uniref:Glycosyltransferase family 2 protein n=1 Tax=Swingsia samuiensis TaxID=1293412 RepID=A0A4Y6UJM5_9PROT|nr:glycosyltransferase family 2 protein [Swingsia samuiensis]QDH17254.1 glycosyltransferase family 2 protein [Swingsia samuiensis]